MIMALQQLQVTALQPKARAMDTYMRPEVQKNAEAIGRLLGSIEKTDNDRAIKNAEIEAVTEAMSKGPEDLHNRVGFSSTRPDYIATRLEHRGTQFMRESLPQLESDFQEYLLGANDNGTDIQPFLDEKFGAVMAQLQGDGVGNGSQFLIAGASEGMINAKADMQKRHMEYIDKRAMDETMGHLSMRVDGIVHQKLANNRPDGSGGTLPPQAFNDRIKDMDSLAVEMSQTTTLTKGQANKAVFESLLAMAGGNGPENAERYLHMAKLVRYAKGKNGELRPEAFEAIQQAEYAADSKMNSKAIADAAALKAAKEKAAKGAYSDFINSVTATEGRVTELTPATIQYLVDNADMSPEKIEATMDAVNKLTGGTESEPQMMAFVNFSTALMSNRQNPNIVSSYSELMKAVANEDIHPSRLKEAQAMLKGIEQAAPLINNLLNTQPRGLWVSSIVKMEDEFDRGGLALKAELTGKWNDEFNKLIEQHYQEEGAVAPSTTQLQSMSDYVKNVMDNNYSELVAERAEEETAYKDYKVGVNTAITNSENSNVGDGKLNVGGAAVPFADTTIGTSGLTHWSGELPTDVIHNKINPVLRRAALFNPAKEFTLEDAQSPEEELLVGKTNAEMFDLLWGDGAFARYYKEYGPKVIRLSTYKASLTE
tara:strand:- start:505 stop:2466 length:1962 start_codon:yes stop_codon:yes gene_type:complete